MFDIIDNFLREHAPSWYRTPQVQTAVLGLVFFWVFAAYTTIQFYAASTYGSDLAADSVSAIYLTFTLTCLISPGIVNKWGCRRSMFYGVLGYASLVLVSLIYFLCGGTIWTRRLVVMGGAVLGCGASILWTAQGRLILQYASRAELETNVKPTDDGKKMSKSNSATQSGKLVGMFWAIFQCSSLVGGSISFLYYNNKPQGSTTLYALFLVFILIGALFTQTLLPPEILLMTPTTDTMNNVEDVEETSTELTPLTVNDNAKYASEALPIQTRFSDDLSNQSWTQESLGTLKLFFTQRMMFLFLLFFYTGFNQPYQQATFGNRFFTRRTIGVELIVFHLMEIIGAIVCGRLLDFESPTVTRRKRAIACLVAFIVINTTGNMLAAIQEYAAKQNGSAVAHDIADMSVVLPSLAFACWGFSDAQIQVFCYWLMADFFTSGSDHSRAVGCYKCAQSFGTSIGFYCIPTSRLSEVSQLTFSSLVFIAGTALAFSQLPPS